MSIRDDLKAFLDGELSPGRAAEVQAAIDLDPALREEVEFMKLLSGEIKTAAAEPQVKGLDRVMDRVAKLKSGWIRWAGYGASGLAAVFLIGYVGMNLTSGGAAEEAASTSTASPTFKSADSGRPEGGSMSQKKTSDSIAGVGGGLGEAERAVAPSEETRSSNGVPDSEGVPVRNSRNYIGFVERQPKSNAPTVFEPDRVVVRSADVGLKVSDVAKAVAETERTVMAMGGIVGSTNFDSSVDNAKATMDFRIPVKNFSAILDSLSKQGTVVRKNTSGQDVTAQVADADGRIRALADEEHNLIAELQQARNSSVRLEIRSRLSYVRQELEGLKSQNNATKDLAAMSRVTVSFEQAGQLDQGKGDDWFNQTTQGAGNMLGFIGRIFGVGFIYTAFLAPVWLPIVGIVWWTKRRNRIA